jgi:hypothetical protein
MEWTTAESMRPARSTFVTVVAWIFIALDGMAALISLAQNIVVNALFPFDQLREGMAKAEGAGRLPPWFASVFEHIRPLLLAMLIYVLIKLVAAIGLLNRQNWARLVFIGLLALGILWSLVGIVLQQFFIASMLTIPLPPKAPRDFDAMMQGALIVIRVVSAVFAIGFAVLYAWMIRKLVSPPIVAEFRAT